MNYAITGGIASGKSRFCQRLRAAGNPVYDCDAAAKRIVRTHPDVRRQLTGLVGTSLYAIDGTLDKKALAAYLTASPENASRVDAIVHPRVAEDYRAWQQEQTEKGARHTFMECALLFESGFDRLADRTVLIYAREATRLRRLMARDGITEQQARRWMALQMPEEEKLRRADIVIPNEDR
ncbi:MAG: dephospho-CoA kinase [Bacteroidaceae bacterium]|nr:dephospho-CoA kinase [Bacteroidaceae bacterium]